MTLVEVDEDARAWTPVPGGEAGERRVAGAQVGEAGAVAWK
jgi:hypothetical protein